MYGYLGRWWRWLLLAAVFGALAGVIYYSVQNHPAGGHTATATILIENPLSHDRQPPPVSVEFSSGTWPTEQAAVADIAVGVGRVVGYSQAPVLVQDIKLSQSIARSPWWKAAVLGSVISSLLVIGWIYIWEDRKAFSQHRRQMGTNV